MQEHPRPQHLPVLLRFRPCRAGWPSWQEEVAGHTPARHWGARRWGGRQDTRRVCKDPHPWGSPAMPQNRPPVTSSAWCLLDLGLLSSVCGLPAQGSLRWAPVSGLLLRT